MWFRDRVVRGCNAGLGMADNSHLVPSHHPLFTKFCICTLLHQCLGHLLHFNQRGNQNISHDPTNRMRPITICELGHAFFFRVSWQSHVPTLTEFALTLSLEETAQLGRHTRRESSIVVQKVGCLKRIIRDISRLLKHVRVLHRRITAVYRVRSQSQLVFHNFTYRVQCSIFKPSPPCWVPERGVGNEESPDISHSGRGGLMCPRPSARGRQEKKRK